MKRLAPIFTILSLLFILSMFYRVASGVIAPDLIRDLGLNAEMLGNVGGAFFYAFAFAQIPMGPLLDRMGPRIVIPCFAFIGALGSLLFGFAHSYPAAIVARVLMGAGMASMLMGSLKVFTLSFPARTFSTLAGTFISVGTLGSAGAASPLAYCASLMGWRMTFIAAAAVTTLLGMVAFRVLAPTSASHRATRAELPDGLTVGRSAAMILGSLSYWQIAMAAFFRYGTFVALQGLWFGLYLMDVRGLSPVEAGNILVMLSVGNAAGGPIAGRMADRGSTSIKGVTLGGLTLYCLSILPLTGLFSIHSIFWYGVIGFSLGFFHSFGALLYSHAKGLFPITIAGTAMAWVNLFIMAGGAVLTSGLGKVIERYPRTGSVYPPEAYYMCFWICFLSMAASLVFYAFSKARG
jgi:MFS family permease